MRAFPCQSAAAFPASLPRRSRASLLWRSLLVSRGVPLPLPFLSGASYSVIAPLQAASLPLRRSLPASSPLRCPGPPLCHCVPAGQQLCRSAQASNIFPMALCRIAPGQQLRHGAPASNFATAPQLVSSSAAAPRPAKAPPQRRSAAPLRRPCQQQTSSGGEKYSGSASNLAHLGRIC